MGQNKRSIGADHERIACEYLEGQGYKILECNFYSSAGEIDVVARHNGYLVFVEVKYRRDTMKGSPLEAISVQKQKTISKCALYYMKRYGLSDEAVRFDVVGILGEQVQVIQNAFDFVV